MNALKSTSIQFVKGVGPARMKIFENLGVRSVEDLLYLFPRRYEDRRQLTPIAQTKLGEWQTICGEVMAQDSRRSWFTRKHVSEVVLDDKTGRMACTWFNQPYLQSYFKPGVRVVCHGKVGLYKNQLQMIAPEYEIIDEEEVSLSIGRIVPIYPLTRGITQRFLRKVTKACLNKFAHEAKDELPVSLRNKLRLHNLKWSLQNIHFPEKMEDQEEALRRVSFEEFYFFQICVALRRMSVVQKPGTAHQLTDAQTLGFINSLPFELTNAQKKAVREIRADMAKPTPMHRLLQGDVGSGKTLVAIFGCWTAVVNGHQACLLAPTEILARQHFEKIKELAGKTPTLSKIAPAILTSQMKTQERETVINAIASGKINLLIGTHALMKEEVVFKDLSFVVIDEQHKFGVKQRALLTEKGKNPDVLIMTATPIPRTLTITLYGDMDVSIIDEMPKGRGRIKTEFFELERASEVYKIIVEKVKKGQQAYIVYPVIDESEELDLKAAQAMFKKFQKEDFKGFKLGLIHGKMDRSDTEEIMNKFKAGEIQILVATTVVEVGLDVPNANVMVIEHAERFGLAQLHQLRGRIGRGKDDALCLLIGEPTTQEAQLRIKAILSTTDGFKIAQHDLEIRGPGSYFDRHQHGISELKIANPATQLELLEIARQEAQSLTQDDPKLAKPQNVRVKEIIEARYPTYLNMAKAG